MLRSIAQNACLNITALEMQLFCICYELVKTLVLYDVINNKNFVLIHSRSCNECFHEAYIRVSSGVQFPRVFLHWAKFSEDLSMGFPLAFELTLNVKG